jgi:hypothetical protein
VSAARCARDLRGVSLYEGVRVRLPRDGRAGVVTWTDVVEPDDSFRDVVHVELDHGEGEWRGYGSEVERTDAPAWAQRRA